MFRVTELCCIRKHLAGPERCAETFLSKRKGTNLGHQAQGGKCIPLKYPYKIHVGLSIVSEPRKMEP